MTRFNIVDTSSQAITTSFQPGSHVCSIFQTEEQQFTPVAAFLKEGLEAGQKFIYTAGEYSESDIKRILEAYGIGISDYIASNQFVMLTKYQDYLKDNFFDGERMIAFLKEAGEEANKEGFSGLRVTGEAGWALDVNNDPSIMNKLFDYEVNVNRVFSDGKSSALCQYDEKKFPHEFLVKVIRSHPYIIINGKFYENKYFYVSPEMAVIEENIPSDAYDTMISLITEN